MGLLMQHSHSRCSNSHGDEVSALACEDDKPVCSVACVEPRPVMRTKIYLHCTTAALAAHGFTSRT